jgi:hypothetical protein
LTATSVLKFRNVPANQAISLVLAVNKFRKVGQLRLAKGPQRDGDGIDLFEIKVQTTRAREWISWFAGDAI